MRLSAVVILLGVTLASSLPVTAEVDRRADEVRVRSNSFSKEAVVVHSHTVAEAGSSHDASVLVELLSGGATVGSEVVTLDMTTNAGLCAVCGETCGTFTDAAGDTSDLLCVDEGAGTCLCRTPRLETVIPFDAPLPGDIDVALTPTANAAPDPDPSNDQRSLSLTNPLGAKKFALDHLIVNNTSIGTGALSNENAAEYLVVSNFSPGGLSGMDVDVHPSGSWLASWAGALSLPNSSLRFTARGDIGGNPVAPFIQWVNQGPGQFGALVGQGVGFGNDTFRVEMRSEGRVVFAGGPYESNTLPVVLDFICTDLSETNGAMSCCQGSSCFVLDAFIDQNDVSGECFWEFVPGIPFEMEVTPVGGGPVQVTADEVIFIQNLSGAAQEGTFPPMVIDKIEVRAEGIPDAFFFDEQTSGVGTVVPALSVLALGGLALGLLEVGRRRLARRTD